MTKTEAFAAMDFATLCAQADGPFKKWFLIKTFGADLRNAGIADPYTLSCKELEEQISRAKVDNGGAAR
jgi:hypothetical protein